MGAGCISCSQGTVRVDGRTGAGPGAEDRPHPDDISDVRAAAVATGGVAYWVALTRRAPIQPGATVLVNGAAGGMAVQIARHFGAHRIVVVGRNRDRLNDLDADIRIALDDDANAVLHAQFDRSVDVTLDFLWGQPTARTIAIAATKDRGAPNGRAQFPIRPAWDCRGNRERCRFRRPSKTLSDDRTALRGFGGMFL